MSQTYENTVLGVQISYPNTIQVVEDQHLSEEFGFTCMAKPWNGAQADARFVLRVTWVSSAAPDVEQAVQRKRQQVPTVAMEQATLDVGEQPAIALFPVPGLETNSYIYVASNGRLYEIVYGRGALDADGRALLAGLVFEAPTQSPESLGLALAEDTLRPQPKPGWEALDSIASRKSSYAAAGA